MSVEAYPLQWPAGWRRTPDTDRTFSQFRHHGNGNYGTRLTVAQGTKRLMEQIRYFTRSGHAWRIDPDLVVVSTNMKVRLDGLPRSGQRAPEDPGVAVYFNLDGRDVVLACDKWNSVADNLAAIAKTLEAMRGLERWGVSDMLARAFTGFAALPDLSLAQPWRDVLGCHDIEDPDEVKRRYRRLLQDQHPDRGGDNDQFIRIRKAWEQAERELGL